MFFRECGNAAYNNNKAKVESAPPEQATEISPELNSLMAYRAFLCQRFKGETASNSLEMASNSSLEGRSLITCPKGSLVTDEFGWKPLPQAFRDLDSSIRLQVIFKDGGKNPRDSKSRPVECVYGLRFAVSPAETDIRSASLEVSEIAATGNLKPPFLSTSPYFNVKLLGMREADIASADQQNPVRQIQFLQ
jgi:hypothetical protein